MNSKNTFSKEGICTYSFRDANNNVFPSYILQEFQDIASTHAEILKVGYNDLIARDLIWVITKSRFHIYKDIPYDEFKEITWPQKKGVLDFNREYKFVDKNGNILVKGTSKWCILNINTRKLVRTREVNYEGIDDFNEEVNFDDPYETLVEFEHNENNYLKTFDVNYSLLDHNLHLNNTHYASFILDSIEGIEKKKITDLQINYLNECHFKQKVSTYYKKHDDSNKIIIEGIRDDGVISFIGLVTLENI